MCICARNIFGSILTQHIGVQKNGSKVVPESPYGEVFGTFECKYVGSVPVKASSGNDVLQNAVDRMLSLKNRERDIILIVS